MNYLLRLFSAAVFVIFIAKIVASSHNESQTFHRYIWANYHHAAGNLEEADVWYSKIFTSDQPSVFTYKSFLYFLKDTDNFKRIIQLMPALEAHKDLVDNPDIQLIFIQALEKVGRQEEAINRLIQANNNHKGHRELAFFTVNLYLRRKEPKNALIVIDNFFHNCSHRPNNYIFYFIKGQILVQLNQIDQAIKQIKQCLEIHPHFEKGWLFYARLEEQQKSFENAIKGYLTYLELTGGNREIEQHLIQIILKKTLIKQHSTTIAVNASVIKQAISLFKEKRFQEALDFLQKNLNKPKHSTNLTLHVNLEEHKKSLKQIDRNINNMVYSDNIHLIPPTCFYLVNC